jgi:hypothetical protein
VVGGQKDETRVGREVAAVEDRDHRRARRVERDLLEKGTAGGAGATRMGLRRR